MENNYNWLFLYPKNGDDQPLHFDIVTLTQKNMIGYRDRLAREYSGSKIYVYKLNSTAVFPKPQVHVDVF